MQKYSSCSFFVHIVVPRKQNSFLASSDERLAAGARGEQKAQKGVNYALHRSRGVSQ